MRSSLQFQMGRMLFGVAALFVSAVNAQTRPAKLFLLEDTKNQRWCSYTDSKLWEKERDATDWKTAGAVDYADGKITRVFLTVPSEKGDWVISDEYAVNPQGVIETMTRYTDLFAGGFFEKSVYWIEEAQAVLMSREMKTQENVLLGADPDSKQDEVGHTYKGHLLRDLPVWLRLNEFPFGDFLAAEHTEVWEKGRACVSSL